MRPKVKEINLLPKEYIQAQKVKLYILLGIFALFLECIIFVLTVVIPPMAEIKEQQNTLLDLQVKVSDPKFAEVNKTIADLNQSKEEVKKWVGKYEKIKQPDFISGRLLDELTARIPQGVTIDNIDAKTAVQAEGQAQTEGTTVTIKGRTQITNSVMHYVNILETTYKGAMVSFNVDDAGIDDTYQKYDITIKMPAAQPAKTEEPQKDASADSAANTQQEETKGGAES